MKTKAEFASTKVDDGIQNGRRKGGKQTTKNVPCIRKLDSYTSQMLNGVTCAKNEMMFDAMGAEDEMNYAISATHSLSQKRTSCDVPESPFLSQGIFWLCVYLLSFHRSECHYRLSLMQILLLISCLKLLLFQLTLSWTRFLLRSFFFLQAFIQLSH